MPALADRLFSWTVPIEGVERNKGWDWDGGENSSEAGWCEGGDCGEEHQFQHVVPANLLVFLPFCSPAVSPSTLTSPCLISYRAQFSEEAVFQGSNIV